MKHHALAILLAATLVLSGCGWGPGHHHGDINGNWTATLTDANGSPEFAFATSLFVNHDGTLSITNFNFSTNSPCFVSGQVVSGSFGFTGDFNGQVTGHFALVVVSGSPSGNTLQLSGTVNGNTITGTWTLSGGTGCTGFGNFTMTR
jgi:hypothetical protein